MLAKAPKVYRDPIHNFISYEDEGDLGRLITSLVDAREFQRLRFVRQVGLANLVFHGAEHSRFSHSMGVAHLARRMFDRVRPGMECDDPTRVAVIVAALLHDVGHGPFSHAMERVFGFHHEDYSRAMVCDEDSHLCGILTDYDASLPERVATYIDHSVEDATRDIVSSQIDADRLDYLLRDGYMTGVENGRYDLERILLMLELDQSGLVVNVRAFESIEGYLVARYHMYRLVYFHRAVRAAEAMLQKLFERALRLMHDGVKTIDGTTILGRLMVGEPVGAAEFARLSEIDAWAQIRAWSEADDAVIADLSSALIERRLYRAVDRSVAPEEVPRLEQAEREILERLGPDGQHAFVVDVASDEPYRPYLPGQAASGGAIRIRDRSGAVAPIEDKSPIVEALAGASYRLRRWCYHPAVHDLVAKVSKSQGREI